jgi:inorganic phosphate transporter, PiT family
MDLVLLAAAGAFAVLNGFNDGGTVLAMGLKIPALRLGPAVLLLAGSVVAAPLAFTA